jgi:hypothetical protein
MFLPTKTKYESDGDEDYGTQSASGTSDYYSTWIEGTETSQFVGIVQALTQIMLHSVAHFTPSRTKNTEMNI